MSDYLGQLAVKQCSLVQTLHPRLAARFEPLAGIAGPHLEPDFDSDPSREAPSVGLANPSAPLLTRALPVEPQGLMVESSIPGEASQAGGVVSSTTQELDGPALSMPPLAWHSLASSQPKSPHLDRESSLTISASLPIVGDPSRPVRSWPEQSAQTGGSNDAGSIGSISPLVERRQPGLELIASTTSLRQAIPVASQSQVVTSQPVLAAVSTAPPSIVIHPQVSKLVEPALPTPPSSREDVTFTQPEPVIRVTIGRIDVRAVPPPAAASKPAKPAAPKLSLDDYLKSRRRGKP